jgi:hypothetical protein
MDEDKTKIGDETAPTSKTGSAPSVPEGLGLAAAPKAQPVNVLSLKKDMDDFKKETRETNERIFGLLEKIVNKDPEPDILPLVEEKQESEIVELNAQQKAIFDHFFDSVNDGFKAWYDINKNIFTIEVPMSLSNTTPAYRALYKQDLRSKKVDSNDILGSIKNWCTLVAQNLRYERRIRLK